jgi:hypothetical protein
MMSFPKFSFVISILLTILTLNNISSDSQDARKINHFIKKENVVDFDIIFSIDSVPNNLNILCKGILKSLKDQQISIPGELIAQYFNSKDVSISQTGRLILIDHHLIKNDTAVISIQFISDHPLSRSFIIPVNYKGNLIMNYSGSNGMDGKNGEDGKDGRISGGKSYHPQIGRNGQGGMKGGDGDIFHIYLDPAGNPGNYHSDLINVFIHDKRDMPRDTFKIESCQSMLYVIINGGNGGNGGDGGRGGHGADGVRYATYSSGQLGAIGGRGGHGGNGGNGGQVILHINEKIKPCLNRITIMNDGGKGGHGGNQGDWGVNGSNYYRGKEAGSIRAFRNTHTLDGKDGSDGVKGRPTEILFFTK